MSVSLLISICNLLTTVACSYIALRILFFRRMDYRYKWRYGAIAWLLGNACIAVVIKFLFVSGYNNVLIGCLFTALFIRLDWQLYIHKGNVASLFRRVNS